MMYTDLCLMCGVLREMDISGYRTVSIDMTGKKKTVLTLAYHCRTCYSFVRCEDVEDTPANLEGVILDEEELMPKTVEELQPSRL